MTPLSKPVKGIIWATTGTLVTAITVWVGSWFMEAALASADEHIAKVVIPAAEPVYLRKVEFNDYAQAQVMQANESNLRAIEQKIIEIQGQLQYGNLTAPQRAQLELLLQTLQGQQAELTRKVSQ